MNLAQRREIAEILLSRNRVGNRVLDSWLSPNGGDKSMSPAERKTLAESLSTQVNMLIADLQCDPKTDKAVMNLVKEINSALRDLNRAFSGLLLDSKTTEAKHRTI